MATRRAFWEGPERSEIFPEAVWRFLNLPRHGETSLREELLEKWLERVRFEERPEELQRRSSCLIPGDSTRSRICGPEGQCCNSSRPLLI